MKDLNLSTRILMFSICSSVEYDLKKFILINDADIDFSKEMIAKAKFRDAKIDNNDHEGILNQLDLGDFICIVSGKPYNYSINNEKAKDLIKYFEKIIPIRNRVMHTKPLELGDKAILTEVLNDINKAIPWIEWKETSKTKSIIESDPSKLIIKSYPKIIEYNPEVFQNLPEPEFDDTGYIGRKREVKEIKELLLNRKNQIITIVGNGGIGKTAIAVKTLYELIDDVNCNFEAVIWISLKTRTLSKGEFVTIENSIKNIPQLFLEGQKTIVYEEGLSPRENLIKFMKFFKVLLVLDNLETVNNEDINSFIKEIPENSKVLITSRHGIGELEYRYVLDGLNTIDSTTYFRELSKFHGLDLYKKSDIELKSLINEQLYSNPLSIKWFISGIYNGLDENVLLANKHKLVEFCMSNVFEKLSDSSRKILQLFLIENKELSLGEIDYFLDIDDVLLRKSINQLLTTNMIKLFSGKYILNDMAREYLSIHHVPVNDFVISAMHKRKKLNIILQDIRVLNEKDPFSPRSLYANLEDENRKLSSYYLIKALEFSSSSKWEDAFKFIEKAANISPDYFEVYKIKAFISAEKNELFEAISSYQIAIDKCQNDMEKATVLYLFSVFYVIKLSEYEIALKYIEEAEAICPNEIMILLEKSRIFTYSGKYEDAIKILDMIATRRGELDLKKENIFASRYADLLRRQAANFEMRDVDKKFNLLKRAVSEIEKLSEIDTKTYLIMVKILKDLSYLFFHEKAMIFILEIFQRHFSELESINHKDYKRVKEKLITHKNEIPNNLFNSIEKYIYDFKIDANQINDKNKGVIVFLKGHFGFIENAHFKSIYFTVNNLLDDVAYGDKVEFEMYENYKGKAARNIRKCIK